MPPSAASFASDSIEDYYLTPFDLGYERSVSFDHDLSAVTRCATSTATPAWARSKWLRWNADDVVRTVRSSLFDPPERRAKFMTMPSAAYATSQYDRVQAGDDLVGFSTWTAYTVNHGCWASLATIDRRHARDCAQVTVIWGNEYAIGKKALVGAARGDRDPGHRQHDATGLTAKDRLDKEQDDIMPENLEEKISRSGGPVRMLRTSRAGALSLPHPAPVHHLAGRAEFLARDRRALRPVAPHDRCLFRRRRRAAPA